MSNNYTEKTLVQGEKIISSTGQSRWTLYSSWIMGVMIPVIMMLATVLFVKTTAGLIVMIPIFFVAVLLFTAGILNIVNFYFTEFAVTNKKVLSKSGVFSVQADELQLKKIEGVDVRQNMLQKILGIGSLVLSGTGTQKVCFVGIDNPLAVKKQIDSLI